MSNNTDKSGRLALWLLLWFAIALAIRLTHLAAKPAWMDEVATTLFSLGNASRMIPLNQVISLEQILRPLQITPGATAGDVILHLLAEDNHPPTYFVLAHWWMSLFPGEQGYASLWAERALPAIFGALAVPATYLLGWLSFRSRSVGLICAALMAVSPFSVFLSQEARHYSLAILAVIASLCCFVVAVQALQQHRALNWRTVLIWVMINVLGLTIHYFCGLTLIAEGLTLLVMLIRQCWVGPQRRRFDLKEGLRSPWLRIYSAAAGTLAGALLWLPILLNFYGSPQTSFLKPGSKDWQYWINPIVQSLAGWLYAVLSPVTRGYSWQAVVVIVVSCVVLLVYAIWLVATLKNTLKFQLTQPQFRPGMQAMGGFFIMANVLFLLICYGLDFDITRGHRYSFVFFPSILILVGIGLAPLWSSPQTPATQLSDYQTDTDNRRFSQVKLPFGKRTISGRAFVALVIGVGFISSQIIVNNLSNLKFYQADRLIRLIQADSTLPVVMATQAVVTDQPSVIGIEIMSVAWEIERNFNPDSPVHRWEVPPRFVIAENNVAKNIDPKAQLSLSLATVARPFDLWLLGFSPDMQDKNCTMPTGKGGNKGSFGYVHYICRS
ncbi:phospholipid carrier-dependent glycosyltransferase [Leptolyngbya sp. BC1307]|uniref:glycosyltransferase family 39 protein n=1 Tax=Leptolyngbya sp. BC1307 TaxID=2029589 RepID=UPI0014823D80|nr:phospholipid carrier-dependent glycosyltransferase [Leptolyngbya sp. BC1307]